MIPVVADADTLFGAATRGLLIHLDYQGSIHLHWSPLILNELSRALVDTGRKPDTEAARRHERCAPHPRPNASWQGSQPMARCRLPPPCSTLGGKAPCNAEGCRTRSSFGWPERCALTQQRALPTRWA